MRMPSFNDWSRADIISALALCVSILAFTASAVSSVVSWRSYLGTKAARKPKIRVFFEPFVDTEQWWIANFRIRNRSEHVLKFEKIRIVSPPGVVFSSWLGGFQGGASGGGPMHYDLPEEALRLPTCKQLTRVEDDDMILEIMPENENADLAVLIVKTPPWRLGRNVHFRIDMIEHKEIPVRISFRVAAPFPTKNNTKPRYD
jgi:hypothetical protein